MPKSGLRASHAGCNVQPSKFSYMEDITKQLHAEFRAKAEKLKEDTIASTIRELRKIVEKYNEWPKDYESNFRNGRQFGQHEVAGEVGILVDSLEFRLALANDTLAKF